MPRSNKPRKAHNRHKTAINCLHRRPHMFQVFRTFAPIHDLLHQLRSGEVDSANGKAIMSDWGGQMVEVVPALEGWIDCWQRIIAGESLAIDLAPLRQMLRYLKNDVLLTPEIIDRAEQVNNQCERAYSQIPRERAISYSRTEMIAVELELLGITAPIRRPNEHHHCGQDI